MGDEEQMLSRAKRYKLTPSGHLWTPNRAVRPSYRELCSLINLVHGVDKASECEVRLTTLPLQRVRIGFGRISGVLPPYVLIDLTSRRPGLGPSSPVAYACISNIPFESFHHHTNTLHHSLDQIALLNCTVCSRFPRRFVIFLSNHAYVRTRS
jgi:hypothetical protein